MPPRGGTAPRTTSSSSTMKPGSNPKNSTTQSSSPKKKSTTEQHANRIRAAATNANAEIQVADQNTAVRDLLKANRDLGVTSLTLRKLQIDHDVCDAFARVLRGHGRSWEGMAVDILRRQQQPRGAAHARWNSIRLEDCDGDKTDVCVSTLVALDNCRQLQLCNVKLSTFASYALGQIGYSKALHTLSLDLLDLNSNDTIELVASALSKNTSLQQVECCRCGLVDDQLAKMLRALEKHPSLSELKLFGNKCRQGGLAAITKLLAHPTTELRVLDISYQHVGAEDAFDVSWLCAALAKNTSLFSLDLDNDGIDDGHLAHLVAALSQNTTLNEIMLNHNRITGDGVALLAANFSKMKGLKKISMYSNQFG